MKQPLRPLTYFLLFKIIFLPTVGNAETALEDKCYFGQCPQEKQTNQVPNTTITTTTPAAGIWNFIVHRDLGVTSALELDGASACLVSGSIAEKKLANFFRQNRMQYESVNADTDNESLSIYKARRCDVVLIPAVVTKEAFQNVLDKSKHLILPEQL